VTHAETGEPLGIISADIHWDMKGTPFLRVETYHFVADVMSEADIIRICPACQQEYWKPPGFDPRLAESPQTPDWVPGRNT
jgi:hypothetical protein